MRLIAVVILTLATAVFWHAGVSQAKPKSKTKYTYYTISGSSARNLYQQMASRGPHVSGERALASTQMKIDPTIEVSGRSSCKIKRFGLSLDFTINLPKVSNEKRLAPKLRKRWRAFYKFVRAHEQRHRAIWIGCAGRVERKARTLRAGNCDTLGKKLQAMYDAENNRCRRKHDAFDTAEQKRLSKHPLVRAAQRVQRKSKKTRVIRASSSKSMGIGGTLRRAVADR